MRYVPCPARSMDQRALIRIVLHDDASADRVARALPLVPLAVCLSLVIAPLVKLLLHDVREVGLELTHRVVLLLLA